MSRVVVNGREFYFDAVVNLMDDDLREHMHNTLADYDLDDEKSFQNFVTSYCVAHAEKFGVDFVVN